MTMVNSQNGWPASADRRSIGVGHFEIGGVDFPGGVKGGDVAVVLGSIAREVHERVERLREGQCWGHNYRPVTGGGSLSNHASGTAIDINAPLHPYGRAGTFTAKQAGTIRTILREHDDVVRWGGDYSSSKDEMHFEINASAARVARLADKLRNADKGDDMSIVDALNTKLGRDGNVALDAWADKPGTLGHWLRGQQQDLDAIRKLVTAQTAMLEAIQKAVQS
jgi:hypothetical protein